METKKSIQDIKPNHQNIVSDMISVSEPVIKKRVRRTVPKVKIEEYTPEETVYKNYTESTPDFNSSEEINTEPIKTKVKTNTLTYKRFMNLLSEIKPIYLIALVVIIIGLITFILLPNKSKKNSVEQSKAEAEMVKKQLSRHIILPQNEQIDIRKITNKMEDPFFKDASIGDYLIILYKNRIAYIYSVDKDIIINAGVVFIDPKTATTTNTNTVASTTTKTTPTKTATTTKVKK